MAPNLVSTAANGVPFEGDPDVMQSVRENAKDVINEKPKQVKKIVVWRNVILFAYLHLSALYGIYLAFTSAKLATVALAYVLYLMGGLGITAGSHRLWSHKAYKAKWPLKVILALFNTLAFQNSIYDWARDHRVHHKFSETDADPHNARNGLFFSHIGWLLVRKHPDVIAKGRAMDLSDLENDPIVAFQHKHYKPLMLLICFIIPTLIPVYCWNETWTNSIFIATLLRYTVTLNVTWLVNSVAHFFGSKPYDMTMNPSQNIFVSLGALGEGWHNYHHVFPWDYKAAELGNYRTNITTLFIDFMAKIGWAYDLKTVSPSVIVKRAQRTGDGSYTTPKHYDKLFHTIEEHEHSHEGDVWGWDDKDMKQEHREMATIINEAKAEKEQ